MNNPNLDSTGEQKVEQTQKRPKQVRYRFRAENRLRRSRDFAAVAANGTKLSNNLIIIKYLARADNKATRVGIITTRKLGKATKRNRLRRLVREAVRLTLPEVKRGYDIVVIVRSAATSSTMSEIYAGWRQLVKGAGLLEE